MHFLKPPVTYFISGINNLPKHHILKHSGPMFIPLHERLCFPPTSTNSKTYSLIKCNLKFFGQKMGKSFWTKWKQTFSQFNLPLISYAQKSVCVNDGFIHLSTQRSIHLYCFSATPEQTDLLRAH
jgi:hypothetical protein